MRRFALDALVCSDTRSWYYGIVYKSGRVQFDVLWRNGDHSRHPQEYEGVVIVDVLALSAEMRSFAEAHKRELLAEATRKRKREIPVRSKSRLQARTPPPGQLKGINNTTIAEWISLLVAVEAGPLGRAARALTPWTRFDALLRRSLISLDPVQLTSGGRDLLAQLRAHPTLSASVAAVESKLNKAAPQDRIEHAEDQADESAEEGRPGPARHHRDEDEDGDGDRAAG